MKISKEFLLSNFLFDFDLHCIILFAFQLHNFIDQLFFLNFSTDRILWKERKGITVKCDHYDVAKQLKCSDHFPVWAAFQVPIRPGRETYALKNLEN